MCTGKIAASESDVFGFQSYHFSIAVAARDPERIRLAFIEDSDGSSVQQDGYAQGIKSLTIVSYEELHR